mgnify:CR=1 FL=1
MNVCVDDEYMEQMGEYLKNEAYELDKMIWSYIRILRQVCEDGISEGETSKALEEFLEQARSLVGVDNSGGVDTMGDQLKRFCTGYVNKIDDADKNLYG